MNDAPHAGTEVVDRGPSAGHPSVAALRERFGDAVLSAEISAGDQVVVHIDAARILEVLAWLRNDATQHYEFLSDLTAVDYGGGRPLQVVYQLWSLAHHRSLRLKCSLPLEALVIDSAVPLWGTADWLEREVFDLFGIEFRGHPDLRRILMPENYAEGHPLRKDFPLRGRFSRAEQTRRALTQDLSAYYLPSDMEGERAPQTVDDGGGSAPLPPAAEEAGAPEAGDGA